MFTNFHLFSPFFTYLPSFTKFHLFWPILTYLDPSWPILIYLDLSWPILTYLDISWPILAYLDLLSWPILTFLDLSWPISTYLDLHKSFAAYSMIMLVYQHRLRASSQIHLPMQMCTNVVCNVRWLYGNNWNLKCYLKWNKNFLTGN